MEGHIAPRPPMLNPPSERATSPITAVLFPRGPLAAVHAKLRNHQVTGTPTSHSPHEHEQEAENRVPSISFTHLSSSLRPWRLHGGARRSDACYAMLARLRNSSAGSLLCLFDVVL